MPPAPTKGKGMASRIPGQKPVQNELSGLTSGTTGSVWASKLRHTATPGLPNRGLTTLPSLKESEVNLSLVVDLEKMGFSKAKAVRALQSSMNNLENAINYLLDDTDEVMSEPLMPQSPAPKSATGSSFVQKVAPTPKAVAVKTTPVVMSAPPKTAGVPAIIAAAAKASSSGPFLPSANSANFNGSNANPATPVRFGVGAPPTTVGLNTFTEPSTITTAKAKASMINQLASNKLATNVSSAGAFSSANSMTNNLTTTTATNNSSIANMHIIPSSTPTSTTNASMSPPSNSQHQIHHSMASQNNIFQQQQQQSRMNNSNTQQQLQQQRLLPATIQQTGHLQHLPSITPSISSAPTHSSHTPIHLPVSHLHLQAPPSSTLPVAAPVFEVGDILPAEVALHVAVLSWEPEDEFLMLMQDEDTESTTTNNNTTISNVNTTVPGNKKGANKGNVKPATTMSTLGDGDCISADPVDDHFDDIAGFNIESLYDAEYINFCNNNFINNNTTTTTTANNNNNNRNSSISSSSSPALKHQQQISSSTSPKHNPATTLSSEFFINNNNCTNFLSLTEGDLILLEERTASGWGLGRRVESPARILSEQRGWFPVAFLYLPPPSLLVTAANSNSNPSSNILASGVEGRSGLPPQLWLPPQIALSLPGVTPDMYYGVTMNMFSPSAQLPPSALGPKDQPQMHPHHQTQLQQHPQQQHHLQQHHTAQQGGSILMPSLGITASSQLSNVSSATNINSGILPLMSNNPTANSNNNSLNASSNFMMNKMSTNVLPTQQPQQQIFTNSSFQQQQQSNRMFSQQPSNSSSNQSVIGNSNFLQQIHSTGANSNPPTRMPTMNSWDSQHQQQYQQQQFMQQSQFNQQQQQMQGGVSKLQNLLNGVVMTANDRSRTTVNSSSNTNTASGTGNAVIGTGFPAIGK